MKTKVPEFRISKKLLRLKFVEVKLNHKAYNLLSHLCTSNSLNSIIEVAKEPFHDQHHYIHISQRQIPEMRQLIKHCLSYIRRKTERKTKCCFWTITERNLKYSLKHLH